MSEADRLAREIDAVLPGVPGVTRMFSVDPVALRAARRLLPGTAEHPPLSSVAVTDGSIRIVVSVGVASGVSVAETGTRAAEAIRGIVGEDAKVTVRVSRVIAES